MRASAELRRLADEVARRLGADPFARAWDRAAEAVRAALAARATPIRETRAIFFMVFIVAPGGWGYGNMRGYKRGNMRLSVMSRSIK